MKSGKPGRGALSGQGLTGVVLGFVGALLDFYSSYILIVGSATPSLEMMGSSQYSGPGLIWGVGISALGVVLVVTASALVLQVGDVSMRDFGVLMVFCGIAMLFIGLSMLVGLTPMIHGTYVPGVGMTTVGVLMLVNGTLMRRTSMT